MAINWGDWNKDNPGMLSSGITIPQADTFNSSNYQQLQPQTDMMNNFLSNYGVSGNNAPVNDSWKLGENSGLGGFGTASQWESGLGLVDSIGKLYGLKLQKDSLADTRQNNAFNASLGIANYGMKYDAFVPNFLEAQGKAKAVGDWVSTQGGDASKYNTMAGLTLPTRANLTY